MEKEVKTSDLVVGENQERHEKNGDNVENNNITNIAKEGVDVEDNTQASNSSNWRKASLQVNFVGAQSIFDIFRVLGCRWR